MHFRLGARPYAEPFRNRIGKGRAGKAVLQVNSPVAQRIAPFAEIEFILSGVDSKTGKMPLNFSLGPTSNYYLHHGGVQQSIAHTREDRFTSDHRRGAYGRRPDPLNSEPPDCGF